MWNFQVLINNRSLDDMPELRHECFSVQKHPLSLVGSPATTAEQVRMPARDKALPQLPLTSAPPAMDELWSSQQQWRPSGRSATRQDDLSRCTTSGQAPATTACGGRSSAAVGRAHAMPTTAHAAPTGSSHHGSNMSLLQRGQYQCQQSSHQVQFFERLRTAEMMQSCTFVCQLQ